jgi:hypothetical protein
MLRTENDSGRVGAYSPVVLTEILKRTAEESRSGALQVVSGPSVKTVHFGMGKVRFAASNIRNDRLGESMLAHELISKHDFELASEKMRQAGCRFGEALVQLGRLTENEIQRELAIQIQRIVLSLFRIQAGTYRYEDVVESTASSPLLLSVPPLLLKGLRYVDDGRLILSALPPASTRVRVAPRPPYRLDLAKLSPSERSVLQLAGDGAPIGDIIRKCELGQSAAFRSCFALLSVGLLEPIPDDVAPPQVVEETAAELVIEPRESAAAPEDAPPPGRGEPGESPAQVSPPEDHGHRQRVEQLERDARLHLEVKDWSGGVALLHELVALEPRRAEFQAMLGRAMQHLPAMRKNAEQRFVEAVLLAPEDPAMRVELARYFVSVGNRSRALAEVQTALGLDPKNEEAKRLVSSFKPPTRMEKLFRKVFG